MLLIPGGARRTYWRLSLHGILDDLTLGLANRQKTITSVSGCCFQSRPRAISLPLFIRDYSNAYINITAVACYLLVPANSLEIYSCFLRLESEQMLGRSIPLQFHSSSQRRSSSASTFVFKQKTWHPFSYINLGHCFSETDPRNPLISPYPGGEV